MPVSNIAHSPEWYAADFVKQLGLDAETELRCEWSCLLWSKDYWAGRARDAQIALQQSKDLVNSAPNVSGTHFSDSQFLNTVAQVYSKLFGHHEQFCKTKKFVDCPFMGQRVDLLREGELASVFSTILHKGVLYAMLERHPLDSGLLPEEYENVYGIDLTNFEDLENSMADGRFAVLYENVVRRARQLAGIPSADRL